VSRTAGNHYVDCGANSTDNDCCHGDCGADTIYVGNAESAAGYECPCVSTGGPQKFDTEDIDGNGATTYPKAPRLPLGPFSGRENLVA
jgi:hypothetical protein